MFGELPIFIGQSREAHMYLKYFTVLLTMTLGVLSGCTEPSSAPVQQVTKELELTNELSSTQDLSLKVYKTPTCGCCKKWVTHLESEGIVTSIVDLPDLEEIKNKYSIAPRYRSCHSAVSEQGYVFEGHVPSKFIQQFLQDVPAHAIGLSVPGMPAGSPGMEMGDRFMPYHVLLLQKDGSSLVYAEVNSYEEQF